MLHAVHKQMERRSCRHADDHHRDQQSGRFSSFLSFFFILSSVYPLAASSEDSYLLSCGSSTVIPEDGRNFTPDSINSSLLSLSGNSIRITNPSPQTSISPLYSTARVFKGPSTYEFTVSSSGTYFVRLHFYPFASPGFDLNSPTSTGFQVTAVENSVLLLAGLTLSHPDAFPAVKEYLLWLPTSKLSISFIPAAGVQGSLAYVNAIEVFRAPAFYMNETSPISIESVPFDGVWGMQAMEAVLRVNAGGPQINSSSDALRRPWVDDWSILLEKDAAARVTTTQPILYPADGRPSTYFAPEAVYASAEQMNMTAAGTPVSNLTWKLAVASGYKYLVRMHFCDFMSRDADALYFNVYVNNRSGYADLHPADKTGRKQSVPFYLDFATEADESGSIRLSVGPSIKGGGGNAVNAILNGLEIWRVNNSDGSLDGPFEAHTTGGKSTGRWSSSKIILVVALSVAATALLGLLVAAAVVHYHRKKSPLRPPHPPPARVGSSSGSDLYMPLSIVKRCTREFDDALVIGQGGFGKVYRGKLRDGRRVAVKRAWAGSLQEGASQFHAEVQVLSQVRHRNLVSLLGFCDEGGEMILVYEYMAKGTLKDLLYPSSSVGRARRPDFTLSWRQRLNICIGAARGLRHLHKELALPVIHRDIKSTNILIGDHYVARLSDFGISRLVPSPDQTAVSTDIKGSFGYLDPEYCRTQRLTTKSDVYSFGVVLFEVLCARNALNPALGRSEANLAEWASEAWARGEIDSIVDPRIRDTIDAASLRAFVETAARCVMDTGAERPDIEEVLRRLESTLRLHIRGAAAGSEFGRPVPRLQAMNPGHRAVPSLPSVNSSHGAVVGDDYQSPSNLFSTFIEGR